MTIKANLEDGTVKNFPDGTDLAIIEKAVKDLVASSAKEPESVTGIDNISSMLGVSENQRTALDELNKRGKLFSEAGMGDSMGPLDYLLGVADVAGTLVSGAIAEPISGMAGIAKTITSGPEAATESIRQIQDALTWMPKTESGQMIAQKIGEFLKPVIDFVGKVPKAVGDVGYKIGGPIGGAAGVTLIHAIPELLALKGTRAAKKIGLKRILKDKHISEVYDAAGNIRPGIKRAAKAADIDIEDVVNNAGMKGEAKRIGKAATARGDLPSENIAVAAKANPEILEAAKEFGVSDNLLTSHAAENPTFRAVEQGLKSVPGSHLAAREKALIADVAKRADDLIVEFGGATDKAGLSDAYKLKAERVIDDLEKQADKAYAVVDRNIPANSLVDADEILSFLGKEAKDLGGAEFLSAQKKGLLKSFSKKSKPTYARLDRARKYIGEALNRGSGPFKESTIGTLKQMYKSLSKDQKAAAIKYNMGKEFDIANDLVSSRKGIEKQLIKSLGKDLRGTITTKAKPAMINLSRGDTKAFDELMDNIPTQLGPEMRQSVVATALNDAFIQGSRAEKSLNIAGFDDFMNGIKRNKSAYTRLKNELGTDSVERLERFHTLVSGVRRAQKDAITTGRIVAVPKMFDESVGLAAKLYGGGKVILPEIITTSAGLPGLATAMRWAAPRMKKTARSVAADEMLSSAKFRKSMFSAAKGSEKANIEKAIKGIPIYKRWVKTLAESELAELSSVGVVGFLTGETIQENKEGASG